MFKNKNQDSCKLKVCNLLYLFSDLTGMKPTIVIKCYNTIKF